MTFSSRVLPEWALGAGKGDRRPHGKIFLKNGILILAGEGASVEEDFKVNDQELILKIRLLIFKIKRLMIFSKFTNFGEKRMSEDFCNDEELSTLLKIHPSTIRKMSREGILKKVSRNQYDKKQCIKAYRNHLLKDLPEVEDERTENDKAMISEPPPEGNSRFLFNTEELGQIFNLSAERVRQLEKEGILPKEKRNEFDLIKTVKKYIEYAVGLERKKTEHIQGDGKKRKEMAEAKIKEMELAKLEGKMIDLEEIMGIFQEVLLVLRTQLRGLPSQTAPLLASMDGPAEIASYLSEKIDGILLEASRPKNLSEFAGAAHAGAAGPTPYSLQ